MNRIFRIVFVLLFFPLVLNAQSLSGMKFCIDPGHGGHDPANDRYIPQTGFWESESNLEKAYFLKGILEDLGATVILTRTGNDDSDDIPLSQRAAIANANNVDFFNSIHSNGFQGTANSTLVLFRGYDSAPVFPDAKIMGSILVQRIFEANRTTGTSNRGDWSFYPDWGTSGLGVLRPLNMPGTLTEGSFHDYIPESWRLMNSSYRKHEAWAIARGFIDFYNAGALSFGAVAGVLRDPAVNVNYYVIPSTNDLKKPVNYNHVTIKPGNLSFDGDDLNNGFYLFDSLAPGQYTVYMTAEDYTVDSTIVTVIADRTVFADKYLTLEPNLNVPQVLSHLPGANAEGLSLRSKIEVSFDIRMNTAKVQSALSFSPQVTGTFDWSDNNKTFVFTPTSLLLPGTEYTATISPAAESFFGISIQNSYSFNFTTRSKLNLVDNYPANFEQMISSTVQIILEFDAPINPSTLPGNISLVNADDQNVSVQVNTQSYAEGKIIFEPRDPLSSNSIYTVKLKEGIGDIENLSLGENINLSFTTDPEVYLSGNVLEPFDDISNWQQPSIANGSTNIDEPATNFMISNQRKLSGQTSAKLDYTFSDTAGICRLKTDLSLGNSGSSEFGVWIFGDLSGNNIHFTFSDSQNNSQTIEIEKLNYTGWKILRTNLQNLNIIGEIYLTEINIEKIPDGALSGSIYLEDIQTEILTPVENKDHFSFKYELAQNYPNPFNPATQIQFSIAETQKVTLTIYDILGREITKLIDSQAFNEGSYTIEWDGSNSTGETLPSGVYLYRISAGNFVESRKMLLLK